MAKLAAWDRVMRPDAPEPLLFAAWYRELSRLVYADELGDLFERLLGRAAAVHEPDSHRAADLVRRHRTAPVETCAGRAAAAWMRRSSTSPAASATIRTPGAGAMPTWRAWPTRLRAPTAPGPPVRHRDRKRRRQRHGERRTLSSGRRARPFASTHAAGYRAIYDLADLDRSRFVAATGQSGNPLSRHYRDLTDLWATDQAVPIDRARANRIGKTRSANLRLRPAQRHEPQRCRLRRLVASGTSRVSDGRRQEFASELQKIFNSLWINDIFPLSVATFYPSDRLLRAPAGLAANGFGYGSRGCQKTHTPSQCESAGAARRGAGTVRHCVAFFSSAAVSSGLILPSVVPSNVKFSLGGKPSRSAVESQQR